MAVNATTARHALFWLSFALVSYGVTRSLLWSFQEALYHRRLHQLSSADAAPDLDGVGNKSSDGKTVSAADKTESKKQGSEQDLSIERLEVLCQDPNYDIRQAARKVAFYRFVNSKECCARLRDDLRDPEKHDEATAVLRSLVSKVDLSTLLGPSGLTLSNANDIQTIVEGFLNAGIVAAPPVSSSHRERLLNQHGPMLTLEEVEAENGGIISVRVPSLGVAADDQNGIAGASDDLSLRRWQRREAVVVHLDAVEEDDDVDDDDDDNDSGEEELRADTEDEGYDNVEIVDGASELD